MKLYKITRPIHELNDADFDDTTQFAGSQADARKAAADSVAQWLIGSGRAPRSYIASQGTALGRTGRVHVDQIGDDIWIGGDTRTNISGSVSF